MKSKLLIVAILAVLFLGKSSAWAQDLDAFYANRTYNFFLVNTYVSRHTAGVSTSQPPIFAPFLGANKFRSGQWARSFEYSNRLGGDAFAALYQKQLFHPDSKHNFWLSNALFGTYDVGLNFYGSKRMVVCAGINLSDENLYNSDAVGVSGYKAWHICAGAFVRVDRVINKEFAVRLRGDLTRSWFTAQGDTGPNKVHPMFLSVSPEVFTRQGFYFSAEYSRDFTRLNTHVTRLDFRLGVRVKIKNRR